MSRDELFPALLEGRGDIAAAALTITPERRSGRLHTAHARTSPRSSSPSAVARIASLDDLRAEVFVRNSSYYESLAASIRGSSRRARSQWCSKEAPETLEDEDLLEMVNAGLVKISVVDGYLAEFWKQVFTRGLHPTSSSATAAQSPRRCARTTRKLRRPGSTSSCRHGTGTAFGNMLLQRYLKSTKYAKSATAGET